MNPAKKSEGISKCEVEIPHVVKNSLIDYLYLQNSSFQNTKRSIHKENTRIKRQVWFNSILLNSRGS